MKRILLIILLAALLASCGDPERSGNVPLVHVIRTATGDTVQSYRDCVVEKHPGWWYDAHRIYCDGAFMGTFWEDEYHLAQ